MARPAWTSKKNPPVTIDATTARVNVGGNWVQGQSLQPLNQPRWVTAWRVDGGPWSNPGPPSRSKPDAPIAGAGVLSRVLEPGVHVYEVQLWAGNLYDYPADPDSPMYEWGTGNVTDDSPYVIRFDATGGATPPPGPDIVHARAELDAAILELDGSLPIRLGWGRPVRALKHARAARNLLG